MTPIIKDLPSSNGFAFSLVPAREDKLACEASMAIFGEEKVSKVLDILHRSSLNYDGLVEDLKKYERPHAPSIRDDPVYQMSYMSVLKDLEIKDKLIPWTIGAVPHLDDYPGSKSPGLPWKNLNYLNKREVTDDPENLREMNKFWQLIGAGIKQEFPDVCLFARAQVCKTGKEKLRPVWGFPLHVYIEEARFFYPIQEYIKNQMHHFPIAYGFEMANGGMAEINQMLLRNKDSKYIMTDWSGFDKTIPPWLIRDAFSILASLIDFSQVRAVDGEIYKVREYRSIRRWKKMIDYFINTPIRTCKGERFLVTAGVPSGSCFTNLIDSIINAIVTRYIFYQTTGQFPKGEIYLGDDAVLVSDGNVNLDDLVQLAYTKFGMELNREKSYKTTDPSNVHFLGYFNMAGVPFKNQDFLIASFCRPEHTRRLAEEAAAAALGQLWTCFDPGYAYSWYQIIIMICNKYSFDFSAVEEKMHYQHFKHKYIVQVGYDPKTLSIPRPNEDQMILEVIPPLTGKYKLRDRIYDYASLWEHTVKYWY